jgi:hypothetical protein
MADLRAVVTRKNNDDYNWTMQEYRALPGKIWLLSNIFASRAPEPSQKRGHRSNAFHVRTTVSFERVTAMFHVKHKIHST